MTLEIAGIAVRLQCGDHNTVSLLQQRYQEFGGTAEPCLTLSIAMHVDLDPQPPDDALRFEGDLVLLGEEGYAATINVAAGQASLQTRPEHAVDAAEYCLRVIYILLVFRTGGLMFHAAGIARGDDGYCFFGRSGSGKTTVSRLSSAYRVLNDDLIVLMPGLSGWTMYATPFSNPTQVQPSGPGSVRLTALYRLIQARSVFLERMGMGQSLAEVMASTPIVAMNARWSDQLLGRIMQILQATPAYRLHFLKDASFWDVLDPQHLPNRF